MVAVTVAMRMRNGEWGFERPNGAAFGTCSRRAIVRVIPVIMFVRMRVHGRYSLFYARWAGSTKRGCLLSGYLDTRGLRFR